MQGHRFIDIHSHSSIHVIMELIYFAEPEFFAKVIVIAPFILGMTPPFE